MKLQKAQTQLAEQTWLMACWGQGTDLIRFCSCEVWDISPGTCFCGSNDISTTVNGTLSVENWHGDNKGDTLKWWNKAHKGAWDDYAKLQMPVTANRRFQAEGRAWFLPGLPGYPLVLHNDPLQLDQSTYKEMGLRRDLWRSLAQLHAGSLLLPILDAGDNPHAHLHLPIQHGTDLL